MVVFQDYVNTIGSFQDEDKPAHFGLPANIERSMQRTSSSHVISQLKVLMRSSELVNRFEKEVWNKQLSPHLNLWKKLNQVSAANISFGFDFC